MAKQTKIDFMPNWEKQEQCFEEEQIEVVDSLHNKRIIKNGKPVIKAWPHDKPTAQIAYENWLEQVVNPDTNEFYPALNKAGNPIKGTGPKHTVTLTNILLHNNAPNYDKWLLTRGLLHLRHH